MIGFVGKKRNKRKLSRRWKKLTADQFTLFVFDRWFCEGKELENSPDIQIITSGEQHSLIIAEAFEEDTGRYSCFASNCYGTDSTSAEIYVEGDRFFPPFWHLNIPHFNFFIDTHLPVQCHRCLIFRFWCGTALWTCSPVSSCPVVVIVTHQQELSTLNETNTSFFCDF